MPRDINGNYTLPVGNPVVPDTVIETTWANPTMADIAVALSDSLSRSGQGGMLASFKNADGTLGSPGDSWTNEPTAGWYRKAAHSFWFAVQGVEIFGVDTAGIHLGAGLTADFVHTLATNWGVAGGAVNVYTLATTPPNTLLVDGMMIGMRSLTANTSINPTINLDGLGAVIVTRRGGQALQAGDIGPLRSEHIFRYNLAFNRWELMNAEFPILTIPTIQNISATGPYNAPVGMKWAMVEVIGGGGGGSAGNGTNGGSGGGAGGYGRRFYYAAQLAGPQACNIGGGSTGVGGTTTFSSGAFLMSATGGTAGVAGGLGGTGGGAFGTLVDGQIGEAGHAGSTSAGGNGANSRYAPGGRGTNGAVNGENGASYGAAGGGGGPTSAGPSSGFSGLVKVTEFYV